MLWLNYRDIRLMDWAGVLKYLGGVVGITAALAYVARRIIDTFLSARLVEHKAQLERLAVEHSIRFHKLHEERAETVRDLYEKLVEFDDALRSTLRSFQRTGETSLEEKVRIVSERHNVLYMLYLKKRIFLDKDTCRLFDKLMGEAKGVFIDITTLPVDTLDSEYKFDHELLNERHQFWEKARTSYKDEISQLKENLEDSFRVLLGVEA